MELTYICKGPWPLMGGSEDLDTICDVCGQPDDEHYYELREGEDD